MDHTPGYGASPVSMELLPDGQMDHTHSIQVASLASLSHQQQATHPIQQPLLSGLEMPPCINSRADTDLLSNFKSNYSDYRTLRPEAFAEGLIKHPDKTFVENVVKDVREGVRIGNNGPKPELGQIL